MNNSILFIYKTLAKAHIKKGETSQNEASHTLRMKLSVLNNR